MLMKKALLVTGLGLLLLSVLVLIRTARLASIQVPVEPAMEIAVDGQEVAEHLAHALQFQTLSSEDSTDVRAEELIALHEFLEETYPLIHSTLTKEVVGDFSLLYTWEGQEAGLDPILLMAHLDVVPVDPETEDDWTYPPFEGRIADGHIWGRGAMDWKVGVMGILEAVELLLGEGFQPRRTIHLSFGHDEEVGGQKGAVRIVDLLRSREVELEYVLDEGLYILDGVVSNISQPVAMVGIAEKGYVSLELTVQGTGGHSSMPPPETAVGVLSTAIHRLEQDQFPVRLEGPVRQMFDYLAPEMPFTAKMIFANLWLFGGMVENQLAASPSTNAVSRTTTAATMFEGSIRENVLPTHARAVVNFRILPGDSIPSVMERVRETIADPRVQIRTLGGFGSDPSPISDTNSQSFKVLQRTIRQVFPEALVSPGLMVAATDSRHFADLTSNIYRFAPLWTGPEDLERIHGTNERVSVENYERMVRFYVQLMINSAQ
jgi:carboxypeptidase PM20D1